MLNTALTVFILLGQPAQEQYSSSLDFHLVHQFSTPIDGGGRVEMTRSGFDYRLNSKVTDDDDLQFRFQLQRDHWNFNGTGLGSDDPWGEINTLDFSVQLMHKYSHTTKWFTGAMLRSSFEDAIEDGVVLGRIIEDSDDFIEIIERYETARIERSHFVTEHSKKAGQRFTGTNPDAYTKEKHKNEEELGLFYYDPGNVIV